jgi:hypothetical protein
MNNRVESSYAEEPNYGYAKRSKEGHRKAMKKRKMQIKKEKSAFSFFPNFPCSFFIT